MYPCVVRPVLEEVVEPALKKSFVQLAGAGHSPQEPIDQAWAEAQQDGRFGGCGLGGHAKTADASFAAAVLSVYPSLRDTVALRGMPLSPVAGEETVPMLQHFAQHYNDISATAWRCRAHLRGACTRQGVWPMPHVRDARVAPPCPTTSCVWRSLPYLTLPYDTLERHTDTNNSTLSSPTQLYRTPTVWVDARRAVTVMRG